MIEMMLSMAFVAFLMLTIALTTISMGQTYEKGLTLNSVNEAGRTITSDMQATIQQAPALAITPRITANYGFICFGNFTYAYNTGAALYNYEKNGSGSPLKYADGPLAGQPVRLAKIPDAGGSYCAGSKLIMGATELLPSSDRNLAIQSIQPPTVLNPTHNSLQTLYQMSFKLGTNDQSALNASGCLPPTDANSNSDYCAVNSFQFIVRTGGGK